MNTRSFKINQYQTNIYVSHIDLLEFSKFKFSVSNIIKYNKPLKISGMLVDPERKFEFRDIDKNTFSFFDKNITYFVILIDNIFLL